MNRALFASPWVTFAARRAASITVILTSLVVASCAIVRLVPGDPAIAIAGENASPADVARIDRELGLDQPFVVQLLSYVSHVARGDLGVSFRYHIPVSTLLAAAVPPSVELAGIALVVMLVVSVAGGMIAAAATSRGRRPRIEALITGGASVAGSIPEYVIATFLAFVFGVLFRLLPVAGMEGWQALVLPVASLCIRPIGVLLRIVRAETLNVLEQDYIRTARSKRLPSRLIYTRHALPNVLTAIMTIGGLLFTGLIGGAVVVENVFARSGLGTTLVAAIIDRDYPVIQGAILVLGGMVVTIIAVVDVVLGLVDPRSVVTEA